MLLANIKDTGIGIKKEDQVKLFNLFSKVDSSKNLNRTGIGLGLTICKKIVEFYGGSINLEKDYLLGASFSFSIKCPPEPESERLSIRMQDFNDNHQLLNASIHSTNGYDESLNLLDLTGESSNMNLAKVLLHHKNFPYQELMSIRSTERECPCKKRNRILIVDDNVFNIITVQTILDMKFKFKSDSALNGLEAV